jgi:rRNA maturation RNase YbeY
VSGPAGRADQGSGRRGPGGRVRRTPGRAGVEVTIANRTAGRGARALRAPRRAKVEQAFAAAARLVRRGTGGKLSADVIWVTDREMRSLNRRFSGRGDTTDVLAFEDLGLDPETGRRRLGEIVCNLELAGSEARRHGHTREAEAVLYATHGLVHLLGGRDDTTGERREMRRVESGALLAAGLAVRGGEWDPTVRAGGERSGGASRSG